MDEARIRHFLVMWLNNVKDADILYMPDDRGKSSWPEQRGPRHIARQPPDIYAKRRGQSYFYYIEAKGDPPSSQKVFAAIGQIQTAMGTKTPACYAMAFPIDFCRTIANHVTYESWRDLSAHIYLVEDNGNVIELNPSWNNYQWIVDNS